ncbi:MAG: hypothetical protein H0V66_02420 [Bdellovibrionales bacterium]|nr:hypothetical protein [Bdellovibrionales bacterium]
MLKSIVSTFLFAASFSAFSAVSYGVPPQISEPFMTEEFYKAELAGAKKASKGRGLAQSDRVDYATAFEDDFKNLSSEFIGGNIWKDGKKTATTLVGIQNSEDFGALIEKYNSDAVFNNLSVQGKWTVAQMSMLVPWRGFLTRARPLIENSRAPFVHSFIVTWLRSVNAGINVFVPTPQWTAGFDYVAKPYVGMPKDITTDMELHQFMREELLPALVKLSRRLDSIAYTPVDGKKVVNPNFKPFYFDNKLIFSTSKFVDHQDRFVVLDRAELHALISNVNLTIAGGYSSLAYNWSNLFNTINGMAQVFGFNNLLSSNPDKMTAEKRVQKIKNSKSLFTLLPVSKNLPNGGADWTKAAYPWFKEGVRHGRLAWNYTKNSQQGMNESYPILDPRSFTPFTRIIDTSFENISNLIEGHGVRSSLVDGEEVQVNFREIFDNPPKDMKDFLAVNFEGGPSEIKDPSTGRTYRNYKLGNPKAWNLNAYRAYFPNIDQTDVPKAARILSQTWGGNIFAVALFPALF